MINTFYSYLIYHKFRLIKSPEKSSEFLDATSEAKLEPDSPTSSKTEKNADRNIGYGQYYTFPSQKSMPSTAKEKDDGSSPLQRESLEPLRDVLRITQFPVSSTIFGSSDLISSSVGQIHSSLYEHNDFYPRFHRPLPHNFYSHHSHLFKAFENDSPGKI